MRGKQRRWCAFVMAMLLCLTTMDFRVFASESRAMEQISPEGTRDMGEVVTGGDMVSPGDSAEVDDDEKPGTWDGTTTESVYVGDTFKVIFQLTGSWEGGYHANVKIENTGDSNIENWYLSYEFENEIANIWNAQIYNQAENTYVIANAGWNVDIPAGQSIEFGFGGNESFRGFPEVYQLSSIVKETKSEDYTIEYHMDSDWGSGFTGTISITNNTESTIEDWILELDFDRSITQIWNAVLEEQTENHYVIKNAGHNANILAGQTISFGFCGQEGKKEDIPYGYQLSSYVFEEGTVDPERDTDKDGVPDYVEKIFGLNAKERDTDRDGLPDEVELFSMVLDPLHEDTDKDGIKDAAEDSDNDGLINCREVEIGTDITDVDTDKDDLSDFDEVEKYGTSPVNYDTDGDHVSDAGELELGSNPLVAEKSFHVITEAKSIDTVKASVEITLSGEQVETLSVERFDKQLLFPETMPGYIGGVYDFRVDGDFDNATIRFEFNEMLLENKDFDPVIYYFNEEEQLLEELETVVIGNVAEAQVSHFSKYILVDRKVFQDAFIWQDQWSTEGYTEVELILVIDDSGSMYSNDRSDQRLSVARELVDKLPEASRVGVVRFASDTDVLTETLLEEKEDAKAYLSNRYFYSSGGTRMYGAIAEALELYEAEEESTLKLMIVLSDGSASDYHTHTTVLNAANAKGVKIYCVGLGNSTSYFNAYMRPLAEGTEGAFYPASDAEQLTDIYADISQRVDIETDSDGDGISDYYEENLQFFNGLKGKLNKNNPDSDEDGLDDGMEIAKLCYHYNEDKTRVTVTGILASDPTSGDGDGDGLSDCEEVLYYGTSALLPDTDRDGLNDKEEIENWFNPRNPDEDGDNRLDRQEFDEGTNPYVYDKDWKEQREDFFWGFADGLVRGDYIKEPESFAVVAGQITSGFIPYIEIRDILGNLHHNDFAFAGINLMGLLSFSGDTAKLTGRVTKFIVSNMDNLPEIGKLFGFMAKNCPDILKTLCKDEEVVKALKQAVDTDTAKLTKKEAQALENTLREVGVDVTIKGGIKTRIFREATQQDLDLINDVKTRYNAGKTRNAATAKGTINGESIDLECISGKFSHDNYFNKGNFEPPQPENYHYQGPIPEYTNHTEQKIVEYLRQQFKDNPNVSGEIEIISERIYCDNCKVLVDMFETEFPNIKVTRVEVVK